jgi:uncharacterized protein (UPF0179 family)
MNNNPDSFPGYIGYFNSKQGKCMNCKFKPVCLKVVPKDEVEKLLKEILEAAKI